MLVMRGLVERDRKLLGLLSQTAYAAILKTFQALLTTLMSAPDVSSLCRRSAPMGRISTRTPMPWFPMACSRRNESFCRSLRSIPPLS